MVKFIKWNDLFMYYFCKIGLWSYENAEIDSLGLVLLLFGIVFCIDDDEDAWE